MSVEIRSKSEVDVTVNNEIMIINEGKEANLICTIASEALGCSFESPNNQSYNMLRGSAYEQGRIQQQEFDS